LGTGIFGLAAFAVLNGKTQSILDGVNQGTVEALNLVVAGRSDRRRSALADSEPRGRHPAPKTGAQS